MTQSYDLARTIAAMSLSSEPDAPFSEPGDDAREVLDNLITMARSVQPGLRSSFTGRELDALITTAVKLWQRAGLDDFGPDLNLTRAEAVALSKAQAVAAADWDLPDGEKPAEYLGTTADGGEEFRVSWADER